MYGKVFESLYQGSLYGDWKAIITMQQLIVLADSKGIVDMTPQAISGMTSIPLDIIQDGIEALLLPDPDSRTDGHNGVRIKPVDDHRNWGWFLVNYDKYKNMRSAEDRREYMKNYMAEQRKAAKFVPPTAKEAVEYAAEKGYEYVDAEQFINFYQSKKWMVGGNKMSCWHSAMAGWNTREKKNGGIPIKSNNPLKGYA